MQFDEKFNNITNDCEPVYAWLWNSTITKEGIRERIDDMLNCGIKAFYVIAEPSNFRPGRRNTVLYPDYLSDEYIDLLKYSCEYAAKKGMRTWLYNEGGFPSGSAAGKVVKKDNSLRSKSVTLRETFVKNGESYLPDLDVIAAFDGKNRVNEGRVFAEDTMVKEYICTETLNVDPLCSGNNTDIADEKTGRIFIEETHQRLLDELGSDMMKTCSYMFDDEAHMGSWTSGLAQLFRAEYGYDMEDYIPYICGEYTPQTEAAHKACADYEMLCGKLQIENYFVPMKHWLNAHGMHSIGHLDKDNETDGFMLCHYGNTLKMLRCFDIPGIDVIWRQISYPVGGKCCSEGFEFFPRLASSAARQNGCVKALSESFAVYGTDLTPEEMRFVINFQAVRGINLFNFMAMSYEREGILPFQFRPNFISANPGFDTLSQINTYTARLCYLMQSGKTICDTALYYPFRTICAGGKQAQDAKQSFEDIGHELERRGITFDLIDEDYLLRENKAVSYDNIYVPYCPYEREDVMEKLTKYPHNAKPLIQCEEFIRSRAIECGNERLYFITNESGDTKTTSITLPENGGIYEINLINGEAYSISDNHITVTLTRGEGRVYLCTQRSISAVSNNFEEVAEFKFDKGYVTRRYTVDRGIKNTCGENITVPCGDWQTDFSGEVTYKTALAGIVNGQYRIELCGVKHFAKLYVDGKFCAEVTMPPYYINDVWLKSGSKLTVTVANTAANACFASDYFEKTDISWVGPYHENMSKHESKAPCGGFSGIVKLSKRI